MAKHTSKQIKAIASKLGIGTDKLMAVPSMGTNFTYFNSGLAQANMITKKGCDIDSIKTSDVCFTCTLDTGAVDWYYDETNCTDWRGNAQSARSDLVLHFRVKGRNFFIRNNKVDGLRADMNRAITHELKKCSQALSTSATKHIKNSITRRLNNGTCFKIKEVVTIRRSDSAVCWWQNRTAQNISKMVLIGFKDMPSVKGFTPVNIKTQGLWEHYAGSLWINDCLSVNSVREGFVCAYRSRKHK